MSAGWSSQDESEHNVGPFQSDNDFSGFGRGHDHSGSASGSDSSNSGSVESGSPESVDCPPAKRQRRVDYHTERSLRRWHLTSNTVVSGLSRESSAVADLFRAHCKHFCFQLERGEQTDRLHYQCRVSFDPPVRKAQVIELFPDYHIRPESNRGEQAGTLYVMKSLTREDGPWSDKDVVMYKDPRYVLDDLRPWQEEAKRRLFGQDHRTILIVVDPVGNSGKTVLAHHLVQYHAGVFVPAFLQTGDEIMKFVCSHVKSGGDFVLVIDIPRASLIGAIGRRLFAAFEALKGGWAYDTRYHGKTIYFKPPKVVCFSNVMPDVKLLTGDRWDIMALPWLAELVAGDRVEFLAGEQGAGKACTAPSAVASTGPSG